MSFNVLADGKIVERWRLIDNSDLIQQLGSSPQSGAELKKAECPTTREKK